MKKLNIFKINNNNIIIYYNTSNLYKWNIFKVKKKENIQNFLGKIVKIIIINLMIYNYITLIIVPTIINFFWIYCQAKKEYIIIIFWIK